MIIVVILMDKIYYICVSFGLQWSQLIGLFYSFICSLTEDETPPDYWLWVGYSNCSSHQAKQLYSENVGTALDNVILTMQRRFSTLNEVIKRYAKLNVAILYVICCCIVTGLKF